MRSRWHWFWVGLVAMVVTTTAWSTLRAEDVVSAFRYGGDERIREEFFDNIPVIADPPGVARGGDNNYFRYRTRLWAEYDLLPNVTFRVRAANEFRNWDSPSMSAKPQRSDWGCMDEIVLDNLYLDVRDLLDKKLDVRVGRQDLIYGTGKVILEGTPGDGSRTIYFNAAKATWKGIPNATLDAFAIYNENEDELAINSADRDLNAYPTAVESPTESGGGLYLKSQMCKTMPFEAYLIYKHENAWEQKGSNTVYAWQSVSSSGTLLENPEFDVGTLGFRLMPVIGERVKGNIEAAVQVGDRGDESQFGYMVDAFATYQVPLCETMKPAVDGGVYLLSGDDPGSKNDEGWDPLWARYPQFSELYVYAFDFENLSAARWSNLVMPHAGLVASPTAWLKTSAMLGYMWAMEDDGPGDGTERGLLAVAKGEFTIGQKMLLPNDKLTTHLWLELLEPGDYYNVDDLATFARWEVMYSF